MIIIEEMKGDKHVIIMEVILDERMDGDKDGLDIE